MCQTFFPEAAIYSVAASSVFHIPLWRHFIAWIGCGLLAGLPACIQMLVRAQHVWLVRGSLCPQLCARCPAARSSMPATETNFKQLLRRGSVAVVRALSGRPTY
jgi:hypothetical protein